MEHITVPLGQRHAPHNWEYTSAAVRSAATIMDGTLIGAQALQTDDGSYWRLQSVGPTTWLAVKADPNAHSHVKGEVGLGSVDDTADRAKPVSTAQAAADAAVQAAAAADATDKANAAKSYADALVVGLWDDRGSFNASVNTYPAAGGSGAAGAILKGDIWTVSVAGTVGGVAVGIGDTVRATVDAPAQVAANWSVLDNNVGYVPENLASRDASGGYAGLTLFKLNLRNAANTITSWFTTAATVARTWTLPDKDGTVAMTSDLTSFAAKGGNSDITSLIGLTTALSLAQGGTGAATANAAADALGAFRKGTLLGTVSQSVGVPTGAIIERGSNANGEYVRYADGTQICMKREETASYTTSMASGNIWEASAAGNFTFPSQFITAPVVQSASHSVENAVSWANNYVITATTVSLTAWSTSSTATGKFQYIAIGRWF